MCPPLLSTSHPRHTSFLVMKVYQRFRATQKLSRCVIHHFSYNSRRWREIFVLCLPSILSSVSFFSNQHLPSSSHPLLFVPFLSLDIITNYDSVVIQGKSWMFCILTKLDVIFNRTQSCVSWILSRCTLFWCFTIDTLCIVSLEALSDICSLTSYDILSDFCTLLSQKETKVSFVTLLSLLKREGFWVLSRFLLQKLQPSPSTATEDWEVVSRRIKNCHLMFDRRKKWLNDVRERERDVIEREANKRCMILCTVLFVVTLVPSMFYFHIPWYTFSENEWSEE